VRQCLAASRPQSTRTGRPGIAPDRLLRCCVLKHLKGWSFRELESELCSNLLYRRFTHYDAEATPDFTSFRRSWVWVLAAIAVVCLLWNLVLQASMNPASSFEKPTVWPQESRSPSSCPSCESYAEARSPDACGLEAAQF